MVFLKESGELVLVLEFGQGFVDHAGDVQALHKLILLKEILGNYCLCLPMHDLVNEIIPLHHKGLHPLVVTFQLTLQPLNLFP